MRRLERYKLQRGVLYSKKFWINPNTGNLEILTMHMIYEFVSEKCLYLVFTLFDYVACRVVLQVEYDALDYVREFNVYDLQRLAKPSLELLLFERSPFMMHIACIQSIINKNRIQIEQLSDFELESAKSSTSECVSVRPSTPPPIYHEPPGPEMRTLWTGMDVNTRVKGKPPPKIPDGRPSYIETI